jgi:hypothetical protein
MTGENIDPNKLQEVLDKGMDSFYDAKNDEEGKEIFKTEKEYKDYLEKEFGNLNQPHTDDDGVSLNFEKYSVRGDRVTVSIVGFDGEPRFDKKLSREVFEEFIGKPKGGRGTIEALFGLKKKKKEAKIEEPTEETDPTRAAAWHTIRKFQDLPESSNRTYDELNAGTEEERIENFKKLSRELWDEFTVHGIVRFDKKTDQLYVEKRSDLDGESFLKLLELAGMSVDRSKVNFVAPGGTSDSGIVGDTSDKHGVIAEESGKRVTFDHHGENSTRDTSATKFLYKTLVKLKFFDDEQKAYLDNYVKFITKFDNLNFAPEEEGEIYANYHENLYGLASKMSVDDVLELMKQGTDPNRGLPSDYLKSHTFINPKDGKKKTLAEFSYFLKKQKHDGEEEIPRLDKKGFVLDSGNDRFGKILVDTMKKTGKNSWNSKMAGDNVTRQLAAFQRGYGAIVTWSPQENKFYVSTRREMNEQSIPGGFSQGKNVRGHLLTNGGGTGAPVSPKFLQEILGKLIGKEDFQIEGELKKAIELDEKSKELLDLFDENKLTESDLRKAAGERGVLLKDLLEAMLSQRDKLSREIEKKIKKLPKKPAPDRDRVTIDFLLECQEKNGLNQQAEAEAETEKGPDAEKPEGVAPASVPENVSNMGEWEYRYRLLKSLEQELEVAKTELEKAELKYEQKKEANCESYKNLAAILWIKKFGVGEAKAEEELLKQEMEKKKDLVEELKQKIKDLSQEANPVFVGFEKLGIKKDDLEELEGFKALSEGQKLLVLENLKQLALGRIQEEANDKVDQDISQSKILVRMFKSLGRKFLISGQERKTTKEIMGGGMDVHGEILKYLIAGAKDGPGVEMVDGKLEIQYVSGLLNLTQEQDRMVAEFNMVATEYSKIPYEWSLGTASKKEKEKYQEVDARYQKSLRKIFDIQYDGSGGYANVAAANVNEIERNIKLNQFLNSNPDIENRLASIENDVIWQKALVNVATERGGYALIGAGVRYATISLISLAAAPLAAGGMGGFLAWKRAKEKLKNNERMARKGVEDKSLEAKNFVDAAYLQESIGDLIEIAGKIPENSPKKEEMLRSLKFHLYDARENLSAGTVNFGDKKDRLFNQYELLKKISQGESFLALNEFNIDSKKYDGDLKNKGDLQVILEFLEKQNVEISEAQRRYIYEKALDGFVLGATFASVGMAARHFGESWFGWGKTNKIVEKGSELKMAKPVRMKIDQNSGSGSRVSSLKSNNQPIEAPSHLPPIPEQSSIPMPKVSEQIVSEKIAPNKIINDVEVKPKISGDALTIDKKTGINSIERGLIRKAMADLGISKKEAGTLASQMTKNYLDSHPGENPNLVHDGDIIRKVDFKNKTYDLDRASGIKGHLHSTGASHEPRLAGNHPQTGATEIHKPKLAGLNPAEHAPQEKIIPVNPLEAQSNMPSGGQALREAALRDEAMRQSAENSTGGAVNLTPEEQLKYQASSEMIQKNILAMPRSIRGFKDAMLNVEKLRIVAHNGTPAAVAYETAYIDMVRKISEDVCSGDNAQMDLDSLKNAYADDYWQNDGKLNPKVIQLKAFVARRFGEEISNPRIGGTPPETAPKWIHRLIVKTLQGSGVKLESLVKLKTRH